MDMNLDFLAPHTGHTDFMAILFFFAFTAVEFSSRVLLDDRIIVCIDDVRDFELVLVILET